MITLDKAYEIVCNKNSEMKAIFCIEADDCYIFNMMPKGLADGMFANSCSYLIDKQTGEYKIAHFTEVNKKLDKILPEIEKRKTYF